MDILTRTEEIILLAVHQLGEEAYGVTIRQTVEQMVGKSYSVGAIYVPLDRLTQRGFLQTTTGHPTPERGGRRKRYYQITPNGRSALLETKQFHDTIWANAHPLERIG
jgi:PadR family transcriptional regulator, regulatory protein PadR